MNKLISKKFFGLLVAVVCNMALAFGLKVDIETKKNAIIALNSVLAVYLFVQGSVDRQKERKTLTEEEIKKIAEEVLKPK